jgi:hypothetical protein
MPETFPAIGHRYLVDFKAFRVELYFASDTSMTYTSVRRDGSRGGSETVRIAVEPVRDGLFLVTWQESDQTTVVHLEDYKNNAIITHITTLVTGAPGTKPDLTFQIFHGSMTQIS